MTKQPLLTDLPKMFEDYEERHKIELIMSLYANGKGIVFKHLGAKIFAFDSIPELIEKLKQ